MSKLKFFAGLLLYKIAPIKKHRFVFTSLNGHYSDHPKYICNALHNEDTSIEMIWLTDEKYRSQLPSWVKWYDIHSLAAEWIRGSAKALVDNVYCEKAYTVFASEKHASFKSKIYCFLRDKRNQNAYTTFHGIGMKRIGRDQIGNDVIDFVFCFPTFFGKADWDFSKDYVFWSPGYYFAMKGDKFFYIDTQEKKIYPMEEVVENHWNWITNVIEKQE